MKATSFLFKLFIAFLLFAPALAQDRKLYDHYASFEMDYDTRLIFHPVLAVEDRG